MDICVKEFMLMNRLQLAEDCFETPKELYHDYQLPAIQLCLIVTCYRYKLRFRIVLRFRLQEIRDVDVVRMCER